ncbi:hypothetical protein M885DRAFT_540808 [Pelagophyceae sp. CCMP2097]|nr:hypothetical protein M885DRAFT_540808 [Pelagophyceae sp. CCMP2097]
MAWEALYVLLLRPASGLERCVAHGAAAVWPAEAEPNGIVLPQPWPPKPAGDVYSEWGSDPPRAYTPPTYLSQPPQTIRVDVGRQLFVDDFLFDASLSSGFAQKWGQAKVASHTVLVPDKPWEAGAGRTARPFGGGVLVDPLNSSRILLWYRCGWRGKRGKTCLAVSGDGGRHFDKPKLDPAGTNVVISSQRVEAFEIAYDFFARPPRFIAQRMEYMTHGKVYQPYETYTSQNGRNWRKRPAAMQQSAMADRSTFFLNPLRAKPVWAWSLRENMCRGGPSAHMRSRRIHEQPRDTFISKAHNRFAPYLGAYFQCPKDFKPNEPVPWTAVDREDCGFKQCDLYNASLPELGRRVMPPKRV